MPDRPWVMTQTWHDLLFAHWPVPPADIARRVPAGLDLDLFNGQAWLGIVPFRMTNVAPRGVPSVPGLSGFPELNVRTYVTRDSRPGVYFFSLDAASLPAVLAARALFHLPYYWASLRVATSRGRTRCHSRRRGIGPSHAVLAAEYRATGAPWLAPAGSLEYFLTERYCLYTTHRHGRIGTVDVHHPPWPLQLAHAEIGVNTMAAAAGIELPPVPPLVHFAERQDVAVWPWRSCTPA